MFWKILSSIKKGNFLKIKTPLICGEVQNKTKTKTSEMYETREKPELLVNRSIKAVEMGIEFLKKEIE